MKVVRYTGTVALERRRGWHKLRCCSWGKFETYLGVKMIITLDNKYSYEVEYMVLEGLNAVLVAQTLHGMMVLLPVLFLLPSVSVILYVVYEALNNC